MDTKVYKFDFKQVSLWVCGICITFYLLSTLESRKQRIEFSFNGKVSNLKLKIDGPLFMGRNVSNQHSTVFDTLMIGGTTVDLRNFDNNNTATRFVPNDLDHAIRINLGEAKPIHVFFQHDSEIEFFGPGVYSPKGPDVPEMIASKVPVTSDLSIIYRSTVEDLLWCIDAPIEPDDEISLLGSYVEKNPKVDGAKYLAAGHFFQNDEWVTPSLPMLLSVRGYWANIKKDHSAWRFHIRPRLDLVFDKGIESKPWEFSFKSLELSDFQGSIYIGAKKLELQSSTIEIGDGGSLKFQINKGLVIEGEGISHDIQVGGESRGNLWFVMLSQKFPFMYDLIKTLIAVFVGAIVATKGVVLRDWFRVDKSENSCEEPSIEQEDPNSNE